MRASKTREQVLFTALLATAMVLSASFVWAYGGGGGTGGFERNSSTGCGVTFGGMGSYAPYSNGITNHASYEAQLEADVKEEREDSWSRSDQDYYDQRDEGRAISAIAWDETLDTPQDVRHLAFVLENMMANGALSPRQAYTVLAIYQAGKERQRQQASRPNRRY
ncbi:hypothetical protein [uncultured Pseudodesulfovibrio sp.]|uniref:hypothetical protein n=1 Tax=uncultured Pseudodesulfovibrio sp. TaxID=2035858 RepID=UPI0029C678FB|nr:hypothetical protein [uncultured Pseudodesulfovibrio sp.]